MTTTYQVGRVDITQGQHTLTASIDQHLVLSLLQGGDWTVGPGSDLGDICLCAAVLIDFLSEQAAGFDKETPAGFGGKSRLTVEGNNHE